MTQNEEGSIRSQLGAMWTAGGSLQLFNMRGIHLAVILVATWVCCCVTVCLSLHFGRLWGYSAGLVDGQREASERVNTLMKANQIPVALFEQQLKALSASKSVQVPDVSTFVVMPGEKTGAPQVIRVQNEPAKVSDNLNVTIKNIKDLLPKVADSPEKKDVKTSPVSKEPEVKPDPAPKEPEVKQEASKVGVVTKSEDGIVELPAPGETKAWIEAHEKGQK